MEEKNTREINLVDILSAIWKWIVGAVLYVITLVGKILQLLFRHKILTIILLLITFAISQYFARPSNRKYNVDAMAVLYGAEAKTVMQVGRQLVTSSPRLEVTSLAHKLGISDSIANKIVNVEFFNVIDYKNDSVPDRIDFRKKHSLTDTLNVLMPDYVFIRFKIKDTQHHEEVGNAILNYLNNNQAIQTEYQTWRDIQNQKVAIADLEINRIDSLARKKYFEDSKQHMRFENNQLIVGSQYTQLFYNDMFNIHKKKTEAQVKLAEAKAPVVAPSGFVINPNAINSRTKNGVRGLLIGLALSLVLGLVIENNKKWIDFLSQK
ncbi:MAG: hypothetical protein GX361_04305 [Bacteroidales bacterium]|nr:hypothetical protein [Bacteroidales bacterium]